MPGSDRPSIPPGVVLAAAVVGISVAGPLVRLSTAHPVVVALWRLGFSLVLVAGALLMTGQWREWRDMRRRDLGLSLIAGTALAAHFWSWNASIRLTTIAASVTLVSLQPVIVAALSVLLLREQPTRRQVAGIAIAIAGAVVIALPDLLPGGAPVGGSTAAGPRNPSLGNALALLGAVLAAGYYVIGRSIRARLGVWSYVGVAYLACFLVLLAASLLLGEHAWPQPRRELLLFAGLAIGPMLLGHTGMNWALRYKPAYVVNLTVLAEPVGASILAAMLPWIAERPPVSTIIGGSVVLGGIFLAASRDRSPPHAPSQH